MLPKAAVAVMVDAPAAVTLAAFKSTEALPAVSVSAVPELGEMTP